MLKTTTEQCIIRSGENMKVMEICETILLYFYFTVTIVTLILSKYLFHLFKILFLRLTDK